MVITWQRISGPQTGCTLPKSHGRGIWTLYVLEYFGEDLQRLRLHEVVRAACYGIEVSVPNSTQL